MPRPAQIHVDARALQDPNYRFRGIGQHGASLLASLRRYPWPEGRPRLHAVLDHRAGPLHPDHAALFDATGTAASRPKARGGWFLSLSPMTHDPVWARAFLDDPDLLRIALFYDLIPLSDPRRYLAGFAARADYLMGLAWLRSFDVIAAISRSSAAELVATRGLDPSRVFVSGVAVRRSLEPKASEAPLTRSDRTHVLVAGGGDPRKNPDCALLAHAGSTDPRLAGLTVKVFGNSSAAETSRLRELYAGAGGDPGRLEILPEVDDETLRQLYRTAVAIVVPSVAEGFSIPIVESAAAGTPALVSDVGPHPELVPDSSLRFPPDHPGALRAILEEIVADEARWDRLHDDAARLWPVYTTDAVGRRFVEGVLARLPPAVASPAVTRGARPRLAILTPLPPAKSGVADYSRATLKALSAHADLHVYSDTEGAVPSPDYASLLPVRFAARSAVRFDSRISVLGNSGEHVSIFDHLLRHGGDAILHDSRMINVYLAFVGEEPARALASKELGRRVGPDELTRWLHDQDALPCLFLSEIVGAASTLIVHSRPMADRIAADYGTAPRCLPFAQQRPPDPGLLEDAPRRERRRALGWSETEIVICSFGFVARDKAPEMAVWTLRLLRDWGCPARLAFCGEAEPHLETQLRALAAELEIADAVTFAGGYLPEPAFADALICADVAIQLREHRLGSVSGALSDCIAAALPCVATASLADAMEAPAFVRRVPDSLSPVLIAEAVLDIVESGETRSRPVDQARDFARTHSAERYAASLMEALGYEARPPSSAAR